MAELWPAPCPASSRVLLTLPPQPVTAAVVAMSASTATNLTFFEEPPAPEEGCFQPLKLRPHWPARR